MRKLALVALALALTNANASVWQDAGGNLYDDDNGAALSLATWPGGLVKLTPAQAYAAQHPVIAPTPNADGFIAACKSALGGIAGANALMVAYPAFFPAVQSAAWPDVQALILDAQSTARITATQYAAFKAAATANNIPLVLP